MSKDNMEKESSTEDVLYHEGATALFMAIEETLWRDAMDIIESDPKQVRTWVRSVGSENTTFAWSMWRRLPIHEACRRQAPAWLVSSLLSVYPESAYMKTSFEKLPLHLAVESGAAPEVVNLIIVANWEAIVTPDQSGRIPTDILDTDELLLIDDHRVVHESLMRCHRAYTKMQKLHQDNLTAIKSKHKAEMAAVERRHDEEIKKEHEKQEEIREEVRELESRIEALVEVNNSKDHYIKKFDQEKEKWLEHIKTVQGDADRLRKELETEKKKVVSLRNQVETKDAEIVERDGRIELLSSDLRSIAAMHDGEVMESVYEAEQTMRAMVSTQIALQKQLAGQADGLKALLRARGINLQQNKQVSRLEEPVHHIHDEVDANEAASALAAAATAALQRPGVISF